MCRNSSRKPSFSRGGGEVNLVKEDFSLGQSKSKTLYFLLRISVQLVVPDLNLPIFRTFWFKRAGEGGVPGNQYPSENRILGYDFPECILIYNQEFILPHVRNLITN